MNILVVCNLKKEKDTIIFKRFLKLFTSKSIAIQVYIQENNFSLYQDFTVYYPDTGFIPDIIIAFKKEGLHIVHHVLNLRIPVLYLICNPDTEIKYCDEWKLWDKIIIINDDLLYTGNRGIPKELYTVLHLQKDQKPVKKLSPDKDKCSILIGFDNQDAKTMYRVFNDIIPVINNFPAINFSLWGITKFNKAVFNDGIKTLANNTEKIQDYNLVIGYGPLIEIAIGQSVPCIIVGPKGFGGLLTSENFRAQTKAGFYGRLGGEIGELIPGELLYAEIIDLFNLDETTINKLTKSNHQNLNEYYKDIEKELLSTMKISISENNKLLEQLPSLTLKFSGLFRIIALPDNTYLIQKIHNNSNHCIIEKEEYEIISKFFVSNSLNNIMQKHNINQKSDEIFSFIRDMINEKILTVNV